MSNTEREQWDSAANQRICAKLVEREVIYCASMLFAELMKHADDSEYSEELYSLCSRPADPEDILTEEGHNIIEDNAGEIYILDDEQLKEFEALKKKHQVPDSELEGYLLDDDQLSTFNALKAEDRDEWLEDNGGELPNEWLDSNGNWLPNVSADDFDSICDDLNLDQLDYNREVFEHWIVTSHFAGQLAEQGESVAELFGLHIWGRTTTGQAILLDYVIGKIADDMKILVGQENHKYWTE